MSRNTIQFSTHHSIPTDVTRPGITAQFLITNEIYSVTAAVAKDLCGCPVPGTLINYRYLRNGELEPLHDPGERRYCRLRKHGATDGAKYHQPGGTGVHAFTPADILNRDGSDGLSVIEGEFKAMSLADHHAGFARPAIGLSGFFGFSLPRSNAGEFVLVPELASIIDHFQPRRLFFWGDNDTVFNFDFSIAANRFKSLLGGVEVCLPRIPLDQPKGLDDCRQAMGNRFEGFFRRLTEDAPVVSQDSIVAELALRTALPAMEIVGRMAPDQRALSTHKIIGFAARLPDPFREELLRAAKKATGIGITEMRKQVAAKMDEMAGNQRDEIEKKLRLQIARYYSAGKAYFHMNGSDIRAIPTRDDLLLSLQAEARLTGPAPGVGTAAKLAMNLIQREQRVKWAGPLAGHPAGLMGVGQERILVTSNPVVIPGDPTGDASFINELLRDFVGFQAGEPHWQQQFTIFVGWLAQRRRALFNPDVHLPAPALVLIGEPDCGKNLVQRHILTPVLGGRSFDPTDMWMGRTSFNEGIIGAEHLMLSDTSIPSDDARALVKFRSELLRVVTSEDRVVAEKFLPAQSVRPIQAVSISLNPCKEAIALLPLHNRHTSGKLVLLRCHAICGLPDERPEDRRHFLARLQAALPAFVDQLDHFQLPEDCRDGRFGVAGFQHPALLALASASDVSGKLAGMLDELVREAGVPGGVRDTAHGLFTTLSTRFGAPFLDEVGDARALVRRFQDLRRDVAGWADRLSQDGKLGYGHQGNYAVAWRIKPDGLVGLVGLVGPSSP